MLKQNESKFDRAIRLIVGPILIFFGWYYFDKIKYAFILDIAGAIAIFTGFTGFCILYTAFGFTTIKENKKRS